MGIAAENEADITIENTNIPISFKKLKYPFFSFDFIVFLIPPRSEIVLGDIIPIYGYSVNENEKIFIKNERIILLLRTKNDAFCRLLQRLGERVKTR